MKHVYKQIEDFFTSFYQGWSGAKQFEGSGERLERFIKDSCWKSSVVEDEIDKCLKAVFDDSYDEMLVIGPTEVWTLCPHHFLPCKFNVHIGYVPNGKVLGLSKFSRVALILGKRPTMQEQYSRELADILYGVLSPDGLGVRVIGRHGCIEARGVKQCLDVTTSTLLGSFKEDAKVRKESCDQ